MHSELMAGTAALELSRETAGARPNPTTPALGLTWPSGCTTGTCSSVATKRMRVGAPAVAAVARRPLAASSAAARRAAAGAAGAGAMRRRDGARQRCLQSLSLLRREGAISVPGLSLRQQHVRLEHQQQQMV